MRFTVTIEAPADANALQWLAALPEGWRVVEYREVKGVLSPHYSAQSHYDDQLRSLREYAERNRTTIYGPSPIHGASIGKAIVSGVDDKAKQVLEIAQKCYAEDMAKALQERNCPVRIVESTAVPPDTIVGLNPDGTIAGVAKVTPEQAIKTAAAYNKHAMPPGKHCE